MFTVDKVGGTLHRGLCIGAFVAIDNFCGGHVSQHGGKAVQFGGLVRS